MSPVEAAPRRKTAAPPLPEMNAWKRSTINNGIPTDAWRNRRVSPRRLRYRLQDDLAPATRKIMEDRSGFRHVRTCLAATLLLTLVAAAGCQATLATAIWLIKGPNVPAEFDQLEGKKVAVVCRSLDFSNFHFPNAPKELSRQVSSLLATNVPKIQIVEQRKVDEWMDNNMWEDYLEVGRALDADVVLGIDLEQFSIYESQTLFRGKANVTMKLYDCETGNLLVDRAMPQTVYPPNAAKTTYDVQEAAFLREFLANVADQIGRHFYPHDPRANFAADAAAFQ